MYNDHYNLNDKPFQISSDPGYLWLGEKHREALGVLRYGILDNKGFLLLTGDVGTGKTTLINKLLENLGDDVQTAVVFDPGLETLDLYRFIGHSLGMGTAFSSKGEFLIEFSHFLHLAHEKHQKVLLLIDEAQRLSPDLLEEIRLLSNMDRKEIKLLNIFFIGQNEFNDTLLDPENRAIRQRITISYNIEPLGSLETSGYVKHRIIKAGGDPSIFSPEALNEIYKYSRGYPRQISILCDHCLLTGFVRDKQVVDIEIVRECIRELVLPGPGLAGEGGAGMVKPAPPDLRPLGRDGLFHLLLIALFVLGAIVVYGMLVFPGGIRTRAGFFATERESGMIMFEGGPSHPVSDPAISPAQAHKENTGGNGYSEARDNPMPLGDGNSGNHAGSKESKSRPVPENPINRKTDDASSQERVLPEPPGGQTVVNFGYNSNEISRAAREKLKQVSSVLMGNKALKARITGYTDTRGKPSYNERLAQFRANAVRSFLMGSGVAESQLVSAEMPRESGQNIPGPVSGRRVVVEYLK